MDDHTCGSVPVNSAVRNQHMSRPAEFGQVIDVATPITDHPGRASRTASWTASPAVTPVRRTAGRPETERDQRRRPGEQRSPPLPGRETGDPPALTESDRSRMRDINTTMHPPPEPRADPMPHRFLAEPAPSLPPCDDTLLLAKQQP
ncbi:hypothetical protein ACTI_38860 [Actinoplanes sp. OR16]|nr:hypothetical protein ACTI_38860 [Actinoplanes sp. OR16]